MTGGIDIAVDYTAGARLPVTGVRTSLVRGDRMVERSRANDAAPFDGGAGIGFTPKQVGHDFALLSALARKRCARLLV
ncbi:hypothetical protein [Micromonospora sp. NBC_01638]|uniref:hypothetical protein n=1 Tax=Micromonospora sp. NBC_01638 TaxID=2975982 RepID=UPI003869210F|nr:hypothetical protein OG811_30975 [Micromonospora sp. NBC_01638]